MAIYKQNTLQYRKMSQKNITYDTILAIDSSSGACSVSIWKNGAISAYCQETSSSLQAKRLIPMVEKMLAESGITYSELSCVACTVGPGSFTGIRIGLASARAIGFAAAIPVLGFSSLQVIAMEIKDKNPKYPILAALNAGKGEIIYQYFDHNLVATCPPTLAINSPEPVTIGFPRSDFLAKVAATYPDYAVEPLPFYVRPPDAKLPGNE